MAQFVRRLGLRADVIGDGGSVIGVIHKLRVALAAEKQRGRGPGVSSGGTSSVPLMIVRCSKGLLSPILSSKGGEGDPRKPHSIRESSCQGSPNGVFSQLGS